MSRVLAVAASLAFPALAVAHELRVDRTPGAFVVRFGHEREALPIDGAKVKAIRCWDAAGAHRDLLRDAAFSPTELRVAATCSAVSASLDGGYWSLTPDGEVNRPKAEAPNAVRSWVARQYAKWVDARSPRAGAILGDELEIVPVTDLSKARGGDPVTLRVLSAGQPVQGAPIELEERKIGDTDANGQIRLRLRGGGVESVTASLKRARPTTQADAEVLEATLTFEVAR